MTSPLPQYVAAGGMAFTPSEASLASRRIAGFPTSQSQQKDNWCWAAVTFAVLRLRGQNPLLSSQSDIVRDLYPDLKDEGADLDVCLPHWGLPTTTFYDPMFALPQSVQKIVDSINHGLPVPIYIAWHGYPINKGHAICAFGYDQIAGESAVWLYDPSAKDSDDDNVKLVSFEGLSRYDSGLKEGTVGFWAAYYLLQFP